MRPVFLAILVFVFCALAAAQKADDVLATANGFTFTAGSLSENARDAYLQQDAVVAQERSRLLAGLVRDTLLTAESKGLKIASDALIAAEVKKQPAPTAAEIKTVYDANRAALGTLTIEEARPQIVAFLANNAEQKAVNDLAERLKAKYKFTVGKDVNAADLKPTDTLFTMTGRTVTAADFEKQFAPHIYDARAAIATQVLFDLENTVFTTLATQEAKTRGMEIGDLIAAEVTNKLRDYTDEERETLERGLKDRLYQKYAVKIDFREPAPVAHNVSADDDPAAGRPDAPVTVIMFSDFQCSACSATHPVLKKVLAGYGDKVRLVVRDFPLESIHENAFRAARAANAAQKQGKFFEYIEVLYHNQDKLDAASLVKYAVELGLNRKQFELDLNSPETAAEIRRDMADGVNEGARGTPTIFVNGVKVQLLSADGFRSAVDRALAAGGSK